MKGDGDVVAQCARALTRSQLYGVLSRMLSDPERAVDARMLHDLERVAAESADYGSIATDALDVLEAVRDFSPNPRAVAQEYTELFLRGRAPPYEGSYLDSSRASQELTDIAGFLRAFGLKPLNERPDHIVAQLELMSLLCLKETVALGNELADEARVCRDAQIAFLRDHLGRWVPAYRERLEREARTRLFPRLVGLAEKVVTLDVAYLGVDPDRIPEAPHGEPDAIPRCGVAR